MEILDLIIGWATILMLILVLSQHLEKTVPLSFKKQTSDILMSLQNTKFSKIIKWSNEVFLKLFEYLYASNNTHINFWIWCGVIFSFIISITMGLTNQIFHANVPLNKILILSLIVPTFFLPLVTQLRSRYQTGTNLIKFFVLLFVIIISLIGYLLFAQIFYAWTSTQIPITVLNMTFIEAVHVSFFISCILFIILQSFMYINPFFYNISPIRAFISSIIFLAILSWFYSDIALSFILDFNKSGVILIGYLLLNMFADSISLYETYIILRIGTNMSTFKFFLLVLLDFILSGLIFIALPISTGNLDIFVNAVWFKGDMQWIGILFRSTFLTSLVFWIYLLSIGMLALFQKIFTKFKLVEILLMRGQPFHFLGIIAMIPITVLFIILYFIS